MLNDALKLLKEKTASHIDARDTERATLLNWPADPRIRVDEDPEPYTADKLVFAEYLQERRIDAVFEVKQPEASTYTGVLLLPSPLQAGDRLIVSRLTGQRYYVLGKDVGSSGG
ncbi:hypothetical protein C162_20241 [Paenibacillus sp. FSL R7-269]|uniref:hypothetical protein n=1 Tax=Paenibacillus sp. FSL R7-269 TaxID=1226755 RepID=UPI0003E1C2B2|nr:hypothetical protein [Paenibacillus sp. FSL R7-269]ETT45700.1 hypothetical protein C162_20241 [Paenibacillus sp. FSL R7-269]